LSWCTGVYTYTHTHTHTQTHIVSNTLFQSFTIHVVAGIAQSV